MCVSTTAAVIARQMLLQGRVQGLGVRPAIAKLALRHKLHGTVTNTSEGVVIHLEGQESEITRFQTLLADAMPPLADFRVGRIVDVPAAGCREFTILAGLDSAASAAVDVPTDLAMCPECAYELTDGTDRRFGYAFSSCTQCGPRYSIIRAMPYERRDTSMSQYELCPCCAEEFRQTEDRRFHAQTVACPDCGPQMWFEAENSPDRLTGMDAITAAVEILRTGRILALKGCGGYQLICDATNEAAVQRLRERKRRLSKPFAVMIAACEVSQLHKSGTSLKNPGWDQRLVSRASPPDLCSLGGPALALLAGPTLRTRSEVALLTSILNAIVILENVDLRSLASNVNPGMNTLGVLLPTMPLHALLLNELETPINVTSGNQDSEPLAFEEGEARSGLAKVADAWLHHDRPIERPIDDSVVRLIAGQAVTIRAARGIAPLRLPVETRHSILAVGGEQKVACALSNGRQVVLGPHIGDMSSLEVRRRFVEHTNSLQQLYGADPTVLAMRFHRAMANAVRMVAERFPGYPVVLSGGCFQNRILTELVVEELQRQSRTVASPATIPPNDGGLAAGQIAIAAALLEAEDLQENSRCV